MTKSFLSNRFLQPYLAKYPLAFPYCHLLQSSPLQRSCLPPINKLVPSSVFPLYPAPFFQTSAPQSVFLGLLYPPFRPQQTLNCPGQVKCRNENKCNSFSLYLMKTLVHNRLENFKKWFLSTNYLRGAAYSTQCHVTVTAICFHFPYVICLRV